MSSKREDQHLIGQFDTAKLPALPYAISVAGIIPGMISFAMTALGFTGRLIGSINIVMLEILVGAGYIVFVGRNFASVVFGVPAEGLMLACLPIIGAFLFQKDVNSLGFISGAGNAAIVCSLAIIMYFSFMNTEGNGTYYYGGDLEGLAVFMGSTVFMFSGHAEVVAIVKPMKDRSKYPKVLVISVGTLFLVLIYLVFGLVVYISFGEKTEGLIFENMSGNLVAVTKVFHSLAILFSIPVKLWPAFEAIELGMLGQNWEIQPVIIVNVTLQTRITSVGIRLSLLIATGAVAILVPDFAFLVAFCGSFCITLVGLVLPPLMYIILCNADSNQFREDRRMSTLSCVIHWILFAIGVGVCVGSSAQILIAKFSK